jgi:DNA replication and repair protein RecF
MTAELVFERVVVRAFRNIDELVLTPSPVLNVVAGDNGQGKTSLLEALYVVATSKSFRTERAKELVQEGRDVASVQARVREAGLSREQRFATGTEGTAVMLDGKRPARRSAYAVKTPVVVFHPGDLALASGPASIRRTLLDRIALFVEPASADHRQRYQRALSARQTALEERGPTARDLEAFEQIVASEGAALSRARRRAAERLLSALAPAFARMAPRELRLDASYVPGGAEDDAAYAAELAARRARDLRRRAATFGPHKDELELAIDGRSARHHASQGQQRILALAAKIAELECVRSARGAHPVLLLDDVSSELDPGRTGAVYELVKNEPSQVFVTTTRPELFVTDSGAARLDLRMRSGQVVEA